MSQRLIEYQYLAFTQNSYWADGWFCN